MRGTLVRCSKCDFSSARKGLIPGELLYILFGATQVCILGGQFLPQKFVNSVVMLSVGLKRGAREFAHRYTGVHKLYLKRYPIGLILQHGCNVCTSQFHSLQHMKYAAKLPMDYPLARMNHGSLVRSIFHLPCRDHTCAYNMQSN